MKNLKTFLILVLTIFLGTACFSSVGCEYGNVSSRVGGKTYGFYYIKVVGGGITAEYNVGDNLPYYGVTTENFAMLDFYDDGTFKEVLRGVLDTGTWTQNGNKILVTYDNLPVGATSFNAEFTLNSNIITRTETGNDYNLGQVTTTVKYKLTETSFPTHFVSINSGINNSSSSNSSKLSGNFSSSPSYSSILDSNPSSSMPITSQDNNSSFSSQKNYANGMSVVSNGQDKYFTYSGQEITGLTEYGKKLSTLTIPGGINGNSIKSIAPFAFSGSKATHVYVLNGIVSIKNSAFANCKQLQKVYIANSVTTVLSRAFEGCENLEEVVFGSNLETLDDYVFFNCYKLNNVAIPSKVKYIGVGAFVGCNSLTRVAFANTSNWKYFESKDAYTNGVDFVVDDLKNITTAAKYLSTTYCDKYWQNYSN